MTSLILKKQAQNQLAIRDTSKRKLFSSIRNQLLENQFYLECSTYFRNLFQDHLFTPQKIMMEMLHEVQNLKDSYLAACSQACFAILMEKQSFFQQSAQIDTFVKVIGSIIELISKEERRQLACSSYQCWMFSMLHGVSMESFPFENLFQTIFYLSQQTQVQSRRQLKIDDDLIQTLIPTLIDTHHSEKACKILLITLVYSHPKQLSFHIKKRLHYFSEYLFSKPVHVEESIRRHLLFYSSCIIGIDNAGILEDVVESCQWRSSSEILHFLYLQTVETDVTYRYVRSLMIFVKNRPTQLSEVRRFLRIVKNLVHMSGHDRDACQQIFDEMLRDQLQKYIQVQLISDLAAVLSSLTLSGLVFREKLIVISIRSCLELAKDKITSEDKINLVKTLLLTQEILDQEISHFLRPYERAELWRSLQNAQQEEQI